MKINQGEFKTDKYIKKVIFSKAVLWKDRQLSLREDVINKIRADKNIKEIHFIDDIKKETWIFKVKKVLQTMQLKQVGQEPQYYFPIDIAKKRLDVDESQPVNLYQAYANMPENIKNDIRKKLGLPIK